MSGQGFQVYSSPTISDEITWRKPRTILVVIAWSVISASIMLNVFLSGSHVVGYVFWSTSTALPVLLLFLISIFAGFLLEDLKSIVLGVFEALALTMVLTYLGISLPALIGTAPTFYVQAIYTTAIDDIFTIFFPLIPLSFIVGAIIGGFLQDWLL